MNEAFRIQFSRDGQPWPIGSFGFDTGVVFTDEADIPPRNMTLEFDGDSPATRAHMEWVRERLGWNAGEFKLKVTLDNGDLVVSGNDAEGLPPGLYWVQIHMSNIDIPAKYSRIEIKEGEHTATVPVPVTPDPRRIALTKTIEEFDPLILALLERSSMEEMTAREWLIAPTVRAARKACLLNLLAKLRTAPTAKAPLITLVQRIIFGADDRIYLASDPTLLDRCTSLCAEHARRFYAEGEPHSATHQRLLDKVKVLGLGDFVMKNLRSFRQEGGPSLQLVITSEQGQDGSRFVDADLDLGNPLQDLTGFVIHMGELVSGKVTDHFRLREKLAKGTTAEFVYYTVI